MFYLLAKNPKCQQKIFEELEEICPNSNHITALDISRMTYTKACMQETFRIIPVAFGIGRVTEVDLTFSGYTVPAGVGDSVMILFSSKLFVYDRFSDPSVVSH